jgi:hypothetical protein
MSILILTSFSSTSNKKNESEYYLIKIHYKEIESYDNYLLCPLGIIDNVRAQKNKNNFSFEEYLEHEYKCKMVFSAGIDLYGCCEFPDYTMKLGILISEEKMDSSLYKKYKILSDGINIDSLFKYAQKNTIKINGVFHSMYLIKINCNYCSCIPLYFGPGAAKPKTDSIAMLKSVYSINSVSNKEIGKFILKFNNFR